MLVHDCIVAVCVQCKREAAGHINVVLDLGRRARACVCVEVKLSAGSEG